MTTAAPNYEKKFVTLARALMHIHFVEGRVCSEASRAGECDHAGCRSSYNMWTAATQALDKVGALPGDKPSCFTDPQIIEVLTPAAELAVLKKAFDSMWTLLAVIEMTGGSPALMAQLRAQVASVVFGPDADPEAKLAASIEVIKALPTEAAAE
jgi:hypothetical protein